jgi:diguanylate cyclase (GGDEF)-like protein/PAS domain S-box-containing protein
LRGHGGRYPLLTDEDLISLVGAGDAFAFIHTIMDPTKNRFHARLLDAVGQAVIATDPLGKVIYWNRAAQELYGWSAQEAMGRPIVEVTPSEELAEQAEEIMGTLSHGRSWTGEFVVQRKDGTTFPALATDTPVHDEQGNLVAIIGISTDITEIKQTEELRRSEERFRLLAENAQDLIAIYRFKPTPGFEYVSPSSTAITGYTPEEYYADPELGYKIAHPDDRHLLDETLHHPEASSDIRWVRKDGRVVWTEQRNKPIYDEAGELIAMEGIARDVTERREAEEALRSSEEFFRALYENVQHPIFLLDKDFNFVDVNPYACQFYGYSREEFRRINALDITLPEERDDQLRDLERMQQQGSIFIRERRHRKKSGEIVTVTADAARVTRSGQELFVSKITDITERKALEEQLTYQAFHDQLTGLPNRHLFMDRLGQILRRTERRKERNVAVLFMDLDNFKVVNDSLGHELGDKLLVAVVERLRGSLRPEDTLSRFGGDEFIVLIEDVASPEDVVRMAERIVEDLRRPFVIDERELFVRASIGIALGDASTKSEVDLLRDADIAMYRAKEDATDYRMYDPGMYERALKRLELENDLRHALEKEEFRVHYQPKFRLGQPDRIEGIEALIRWEHPQRGLMLPGEFIPIAEATGLIIAIGGWVMKEACRQAKEWQERYPSEPPLSVCMNLSAPQVRHPGLLQDVRSALRERGLEPGSLVLEITEGTLLKDSELLATIFEKLKALGVRLAIDDFGKEYSSLSYLKRLPVDILKIDRSFVASLGEDPTNTTIVAAVISLAHSLGLEVTGEGVESAEQLEHLRSMGCDLVQGHHLAGPLLSEEVEPLLANQPVY